MNNYIRKKIIPIKQPIGLFYAVSFTANELLKITESRPYKKDKAGAQRALDLKRTKDISNYLKGVESTLPGSIILAANSKAGIPKEFLWKIENEELICPLSYQNALIVDGQHRVQAFSHLSEKERDEYHLLCAVFFNLDYPYQAYIFSTININQKPVDKSLSFELYGYNIEEEPAESWSPEKLAVFLTRNLNADTESNLYKRIKIIGEMDTELKKYSRDKTWSVSSATIVRGIMSLITTNFVRDRDILNLDKLEDRKRRNLPIDNSPLRYYYKETNDLLVYEIVKNFFNAFYELFEIHEVLYKTTGLMAQFSILKEILKQRLNKDKNISRTYFKDFLSPASTINFSDAFFTTSSGIAKSRITNIILIRIKLKETPHANKIPDFGEYQRILSSD